VFPSIYNSHSSGISLGSSSGIYGIHAQLPFASHIVEWYYENKLGNLDIFERKVAKRIYPASLAL
jgi:hypothetical protein